MGFVYLAQPYTHPKLAVRVTRFMEAQHVAAWAFKEQIAIYSPIIAWHNLALVRELPFEYQYWKAQNDAFIETCEAFWLLPLPGYLSSKGVAYEAKLARELGKPMMEIDLKLSGYTHFVLKSWESVL